MRTSPSTGRHEIVITVGAPARRGGRRSLTMSTRVDLQPSELPLIRSGGELPKSLYPTGGPLQMVPMPSLTATPEI
jgi:hypothetical protein